MNRKNVKYPIIGVDQDDDDRSLPIGYYRKLQNCIPTSDGLSKAGGVQSIGGTSERTIPFALPGDNTCIYSFEDKQNNRVISFFHNSSLNHSIWYFDPITNLHTLVITSQYLNFSLTTPILSAGSIDSYIFWTDGNTDEKWLNVTDAINGVYDTAGTFMGSSILESQIALEKPHPRMPPIAGRSSDLAFASNNVSADSFQFSVQFVYRDNTVSAFSPLSKIVPADTYPDPNDTSNNFIGVTFSTDADAVNIIRSVRYAYVKNGDGQYFIFKEQDSDGTVNFYNNEAITPVTAQELAQVNFIPNKAKNILMHDQRLYLTMDEFDYEDIGSLSLSLATTAWSDASIREIHLPGVSYTYGIVCFDKKMRTNGVISEAKISIPHQTASTSTYVSFTDPVWVNWSVTGSFPAWANSYCIVRKKNDSVISSCVVPGLVLFYKSEGVTAGAGEVLDNGKLFYDSRQTGWNNKNIFIKLAQNIPVSLDTSYRVRIPENIGQAQPTEAIIDIQGDKVICGNFGITNWTGVNSTLLIRFEKYKSSNDDLFFEIGQHMFVSGSTSGTAYGDHYVKTFENYGYDPVEDGNFNYEFSPGTSPAGRSFPSADGIVTESPTTSAVTVDVSVTSRAVSNKKIDKTLLSAIGGDIASGLEAIGLVNKGELPIDEATVTESKSVFAWDYEKSCSSNGRVWTTIRNRKINHFPTTLSISDKYVFTSQINGTNKFSKLFTLPPTRTDITKLVDIGSSSIFLAIHERDATSLATYSGDNILKTSDGSEVLGDGKSIIGYERELAGGYGTIYPNSVCQDGSRVWFFDPNKGDACRYAANGITEIGSIYKMKSFFKLKGNQFIDKTGRDVVTGYDPVTKIAYFTFRSSNPSEEITYGFVDKQGEERWIGPFDFKPDRYVTINNRLFMFLNGQMHELGVGTAMNFFGIQREAEIEHIFNVDFDREKILRSMGFSSTIPFDVDITVPKTNGFPLVSYLLSTEFKRLDDSWYTDLKRNTTTKGFASAAASRLGGAILQGQRYDLTLSTDQPFELYSIGYAYQESDGHRTL